MNYSSDFADFLMSRSTSRAITIIMTRQGFRSPFILVISFGLVHPRSFECEN